MNFRKKNLQKIYLCDSMCLFEQKRLRISTADSSRHTTLHYSLRLEEETLNFMEEVYKQDVSQEISPSKSKDNLKKQINENPELVKVDFLDTLKDAYDFDDLFDYEYKPKKKKHKKKRRKKLQKALAKQLADLQRTSTVLDRRLLKTEGQVEALTAVISGVIGERKLLDRSNIIHLNPEEYSDVSD